MPNAHTCSTIVAWLLAAAWLTRVLAAARGLPTLADLTLPTHDLTPTGLPILTVIVPARNEETDIQACLHSLLAQDYPNLHIIAVDDRSDDATGALMDATPGIQTFHISTLPEGWLGKTNAMAQAAALAPKSDFLLFTDADILFRPDALRRALAYAVATKTDHLVLGPSTIIRRWDEAALLSFFQVLGLWAARPWRVADPRTRDAIGIGAFNLIRRQAYEQIGGFTALRMEIVEDLALARRIKSHGLRQRFAYGQGLVRVHWASGTRGLVNVMTKNTFAAANYHVSLVLLGCLWMLFFCIQPFLAVVLHPLSAWPCLVTVAAIAWGYRLLSRLSGLSAWNFLLVPFAAGVFIFTLLRSTLLTLQQGGVRWRGTFYPLAELRKNAAPLNQRRRR